MPVAARQQSGNWENCVTMRLRLRISPQNQFQETPWHDNVPVEKKSKPISTASDLKNANPFPIRTVKGDV